MNYKIIIYVIIVFICFSSVFGESLFFTSPEPKDRFAGAFQKQIQESGTAKKETTNVSIQAEKTLGKNFSIFVSAPYTRLQESGENRREHLNQQQVGLKILYNFGDLSAIGGSHYFFATGKERLEIGSEKFGNLEFYGGLLFRKGPWGFFARARWNTQVTPYLRERRGEEFEKVWYFDLWFSYKAEVFEWIVEVSRVIQYDPQKENLYSTIVAPGLLAHLDLLSVGLSVPVTTSRSYTPDGTLAIPNTTFQKNDFDYGATIKLFKYY
ncbi:hypothetical protein [Leptospira kmetyi]|uniref:DUF481 domain-containing protein n=1 Tax=Leptospira kmetyi TaxID=408139 RepID=A0ABX4N3A3_9LEPT|nr:hypothetical protein [Leptospira kmetyi]PJZ27798.1 hypothetical protein CH378_21245 [Leptospira kmetyi]